MACYLVTGARGGMGAALCRALAAAGHRVWGIDREAAEEAWGSCLAADVTDTGALEAACGRIRAEAGALRGIVHAAGIYDLHSLVEMPEADFLRDFDVNVFGAFRVNRVFLPLLEEGGRIVLITSELAPLHPLPFTGIYGITKTALERYGEALRMELQLLGHPVTVVRPGAVDTGMLPLSTAKLDAFCESTRLYRCNAGRFRRIVNRVEARRIPPERVAAVVLKALTAKRPPLTCRINRNPLLLLLNALPLRWQVRIIGRVLR